MIYWDNRIHPSHKTAYMTNVIEQTKNTNNLVTESANVFELIKAEEVKSFIKNNSRNLKLMSETLMVHISDFTVSEDYSNISVDHPEVGKIVIKTGNFIRREIKSHLKSL